MPQGSLSEDGIFTVEDITGSSPTAVRRKVIVLVIKRDSGRFADSTHHSSTAARRQRRWHELVVSVQSHPIVLSDRRIDLCFVATSVGKLYSRDLRKRRPVERREYWLFITRRS